MLRALVALYWSPSLRPRIASVELPETPILRQQDIAGSRGFVLRGNEKTSIPRVAEK